MEYEKCYVYEPESNRPSKRRRVEPPHALQASWPARRRAFSAAWQAQQTRIDSRIRERAIRHANEVARFLDDPDQEQHDRIPTAILVCGPETSSYDRVITTLSAVWNAKKDAAFAAIFPGSGTNLKSLLKSIIHRATSRHDGRDDDEEEDDAAPTTSIRLPNYDLQLLADFVDEGDLKQVIVAIGNTEGFDSELLSEFIELLSQWRNRIPFTVLLGVATGINPLQQRLSRAAVRCLQGRAVDISSSQVELEEVLEGCVQGRPAIWPGADFVSPILERQQDYVQCMDSLVQSIKYAYMSHYYANPLSLFLCPDIRTQNIPPDHFEALRNVDSFQGYCRELLEQGEVKRLRQLLDSDSDLLLLATEKTREIQRNLSATLPILHILQHILHVTLKSDTAPEAGFSKLYTAMLSGRLTSESSLIRSTLLTIRKSPFATVMKISALLGEGLPGAAADYNDQFSEIHQQLTSLYESAVEDKNELRSEEEIRNSTLRTTVVAKKVELSKQKATLSKRDEAYTALVKRMSNLLEQYVEESLVDPKSMLFHELVIYDLRSPHREACTPRPRHAIERALAAPHDYLDCECCVPNVGENGGSDEATLASSQPATAVLYQLYLESGSLINVHDIWQAFRAVMTTSSEEAAKSDAELTALFQRSLADLKYLGFVKPTRKRADHVAKVAWKGL